MRIILFIILFNYALSCQLGCLKCSTENKCEICDISNNYFLSEGTCSQSLMDNCLIQNPKDTCVLCNSTTSLDLNTNKCVKTTNSSEQDNCQQVSESQQCLKCAQNFVMIEGQCEAVSTKIQNCQEYKSKTECLKCEVNYYLSSVTKTCSQLPSDRECPIYSEYRCQLCKNKFTYEENSLNQILQKNTTKLEQALIDLTVNKITIDNGYQICYEQQIEHCKEFSDANTCFACSAGYYLQNNKCVLYPSASIANCKTYLSENKCKSCKTNYYLTEDNQCQEIPKESITQNENCETFKTNVKEIQCEICKTGFYINTNGICTERTETVENCEVYNVDNDNCYVCKEGNILSNEGLKCVTALQNCLQHSSFNKDSTPECTKCQNKFYLDTTCKQGTLANCLEYLSETECEICEEKYYLTSTKTCSAHNDILNCNQYSQDVKNQCINCSDLNRSFRILSKCKNLPLIQNCKVYNNQSSDTESTCTKCNDEFKLHENTCVSIGVDNCLQADTDTGECIKCKSGFYIASFADPNVNPNKCVEGYSYIHSQCSQKNDAKFELNNLSQCKVCGAKSYPLTVHSSQAVCINNSLMPNLDVSTVAQIENCKVYKGDKCVKCSKDFYLDKDQTECLSNKCQGSSQTKSQYHSLYILNSNSVDYLLPNYCNQPTLQTNDNWVLAPSAKDRSQIPTKCKTNYQIVNLTIDSQTDYTNFNPNTDDNSNQIQNMLQVYPKVSCPQFQTGDKINGSIRTDYPSDIQCQYFAQLGDQNVCVSCPFGKTGSANSDVFLDSCVAIEGCSDTQLYNINPFWSQFMSCHKCTAPGKIPVIAWQGVSKADPTFNGFKKFTINEENWTGPTGDNPVYSQPIFCLDYTSVATIKAGLNLSVDNSKVDKVDNCGFALLNLAYSNSFDNSGATAQPINETDALICGGCKPGYKGTYIDNFYIIQCDIIQNCKPDGVWFNACSSCSDGYVHLFENNKIDYSTCVQVPEKLTNCMAYEQTINSLSSVGKCRICKKGYNLNQDGYCELIKATNCATDNFINLNSVFNENDDLNIVFYYFYEQGLGCQTCKEGYFGYLTDGLDNQICIETDFIKEDLIYEQTSTNNVKTVFVNNCKYYKNETPNFSTDTFYVCMECDKDYIIRDGGSACVENTGKDNCIKLHATDDNCIQCQDGYGLVQGTTNKCVEGKIENCQNYETSEAQEEVKCENCEENYYLEENQCKLSQFTNCKIATGKFTCSQCKEGYWAVGEMNEQNDITQISYCLKKEDDFKCAKPKITFGVSLTEFNCLECADANGVVIDIPNSNNQLESDNLLTKCLTVNEISNCSTHISKIMTSFDQQISECEICKDDYFVSQSGKYCQERVNKDASCVKYQTSSDTCLDCKEGYFLEEGGIKCILNPAGVVGCKEYKEGPVCILCITNRFLEDGECREIKEENKVQNCMYYSSSTDCQQCQTGYFLIDKKCEKSQIQNCSVLESLDSCKECQDGFVYQVDEGKTTCKEFSRTKCETLDLNSPYHCMQCADDYYVDSKGECVQVSDTNLIENCLKYESSTECSVCDTDFALAPGKKKCLEKGSYDENCQIQILSSNLQCALCPAGSLLDGGVCVKQQNQSDFSQCLIIDSVNPSKCFMCQPGSYMDSSGKCAQMTVNDTTNQQDEIEQLDQSGIYLFVSYMLLLILQFQIINFQLHFQSCGCFFCWCWCFISSSF